MEMLHLYGQINDAGEYSKDLLLSGFEENRATLLSAFFAIQHIRRTPGECRLILDQGTDDPIAYNILVRCTSMMDIIVAAVKAEISDDLDVLQRLFVAAGDFEIENDLVLIPHSSITQSALNLAIQVMYGRQDQPLNEICAILFANYIMMRGGVGALILQPSSVRELMKAIYQLRATGYADDVFSLLTSSITDFGIAGSSLYSVVSKRSPTTSEERVRMNA